MLVGRERELELLDGILEESAAGKGRLVLVRGEAGIGKTSLVEKFLERCDGTVLRGRSSPIFTLPLQPIREALVEKNLEYLLSEPKSPNMLMLYAVHVNGLLLAKSERRDFEIDPDIFTSMLTAVSMFVKDSLQELSSGDEYLEVLKYGNYNLVMKMSEHIMLVAIIEGVATEFLHKDLKNTVDMVEHKFGAKLETWDGNMAELDGLKSVLDSLVNSGKYDGGVIETENQNWNFENVRLGLLRIGNGRPVCLFIDDIQWADETTVALMHYLSRSEDGSIMVIGTYRDEEKSPVIEDLEDAVLRENIGEIIELAPLNRDSTLSIIEQLIGSNVGFDVFNYVTELAAGVPLNIIEICTMLRDEGFLELREGAFHLIQKPGKLPKAVESLIDRRLRTLDESEREVIEFSSVMGTRIMPHILSCGLDLRSIKIYRILRHLESIGFINRHNKSYEFRYNYIRGAIYDRIAWDLRAEYHNLVADCIEEVEIDENIKNIVRAEHYYQAGNCIQAFKYAKASVEFSKEQYAFKDAVKYAKMMNNCAEQVNGRDMIIESLCMLAELQSRVGAFSEAVPLYERCISLEDMPDAYIGLGNAYYNMGEYELAERNYLKAQALREEDKEELMLYLGNIAIQQDEFKKAKQYLENYVKWANAKGADKQMHGYKNLGVFYLRQGKYLEAMAQLQRALELAESEKNKVAIADIHHNMAILRVMSGENEIAANHIRIVMDIRESIADISGYARAANLMGLILWGMGKLEALDYFVIAKKYAKLIGKRDVYAFALGDIGMVNYYMRRYTEAQASLREAVNLFEEMGLKVGLVESLLYLVSVYLDIGNNSEATSLLNTVAPLVEELNMENYLQWSELLRLRLQGEESKLCEFASALEDPLIQGIAYLNLWVMHSLDTYEKKAREYFEKAGFLGANAYFRAQA